MLVRSFYDCGNNQYKRAFSHYPKKTDMEKIIAVVVSRNRHALLVECIEALRRQTLKPHTILVVNNGSSDYTTVWLDKQEDLVHLYQEDKGSAGGYSAGIEWAYKHHYTWIWSMDDDSYPKADALEQLMAHTSGPLALLNSAVVNKVDKKSFVWKIKNYTHIDEVKEATIEGVCHPFNGSLIHRDLVTKAGLPQSDLYYWGEGSEYYYRLTKQFNIPLITVTQSIQYHPPHQFNIREEWDYMKSWKMYFYVRNRYRVLQTKYSSRVKAFMLYMGFIIAFGCIVLVTQRKDKLRKMSFALWPMKDALFNHFTATEETIQLRMSQRYRRFALARISHVVKRWMVQLFVPRYAEDSGTAIS